MAVYGEKQDQVRAGGMMTAVDDLLRQWGQERAAPALEASLRSPLGTPTSGSAAAVAAAESAAWA